MMWVFVGLGLVMAVLAAGFVWARTHPSPLPYGQRFFVQGAHPGLSRERLREMLDPRPGERVLEIGPGTGHFSLPAASWIGPEGKLELVDVIQEWLDHTVREAKRHGLENIVPNRASATALPFEDGCLDAAFLTQVLGEVPDQDQALRELRRVLKPGGRLVVGECALDPHVVTLKSLRHRAEAAGLRFEGSKGNRFAYFARFRH